jgi:hypothetical protein
MRIIRIAGVISVSLLWLSLETQADGVADQFASIPARNIFRLATKPVGPPVVPPELPKVRLQGVTSILGKPQALLAIPMDTKSAATEICCILEEGETRNEIVVLEVDVKTAKVRLNNHGSEQILGAKK